MSPSHQTDPDGSAVVVLNWNRPHDTIVCVEALLKSRPAPPRILVIDNGSTDDSVSLIRSHCPDVELIESAENLGFAGGSNLGIRRAMSDGAANVALINNDVVVDPDCISRLVEELESDPMVGATGPIILLQQRKSGQKIWSAGGELKHRENITRLRGHGELRNGNFSENADVDYLPGCVLMVKSDVFDRVGLLDEAFFCYMEDMDLGKRLAAAGFRSRYVASAVAYHDPSKSTGGGYTPARKYMMAVNSVHFLRRHGSFSSWAGFVLFDILGLPGAFVVATLKGRPGAAVAKARGILDGLRGISVTPERVQRYINHN